MWNDNHDVVKAVEHTSLVERLITKHIDSIPRHKLVSFGQRLWWVIKHASRAMDLIKARLREEANLQGGTNRFEGEDESHCLIIPSPPAVNVRKDADMMSLRSRLGDEVFDGFFSEVRTWKVDKDFTPMLHALDQAERDKVLEAVDVKDRTPRVVFKD